MSDRPTPSFIIAYIFCTLITMLGDTLSLRWMHYGSKPLIMFLLFLYVWQSIRTVDSSGSLRWLLTGMFFALLGDIFLMIAEIDLFAAGLGSFLVMQICYSRAFWLLIAQSGTQLSFRSLFRTAIPFLLYDAVFLFFLHPVFQENPALTSLWWPVVLYVGCLSMMGILATHLRKELTLFAGGPIWVFWGALLFIASDSAIAINKFLMPVVGATWLIISTYAAAQFAIVVGLLQTVRSYQSRQ